MLHAAEVQTFSFSNHCGAVLTRVLFDGVVVRVLRKHQNPFYMFIKNIATPGTVE